MNRIAIRRRMAANWWLHVLLAIVPVLAVALLVGDNTWLAELATPAFVIGLLSMFLTLSLFRDYRRALVATQQALDTPDENSAWLRLAQARRSGALGASLPAWIAAVAALFGLNGVALILLGLTSLVILILYRIPRQLR
ncbi:MFS transporter [Pseudomonas schmalbachii]